MQYKILILTVSVLALVSLGFAAPAEARKRTVVYSNTTAAVGNSVTIKISGGTPPVITSSNSCTPGVSGYLYQSIVIFFGGSTITSTQSYYCP